MKPGDIVLVGIPADRNVVKYVAQIFKVTEEGAWGVYYLKETGGKWKFPETMA